MSLNACSLRHTIICWVTRNIAVAVSCETKMHVDHSVQDFILLNKLSQ